MFDCSPTGQHFISCKDVSSYLQSVDGLSVTHQPSGRKGEGVQDDRLITGNVSEHICSALCFVSTS